MFLATVAALGFATTFVGAAEQTRRASMRTQALEAAQQELDRLRSLPYDQVAMPANADTFSDPDWAQTYCPVRDADGNPYCEDAATSGVNSNIMVVKDPGSLSFGDQTDPRTPKRAPQKIRARPSTASDPAPPADNLKCDSPNCANVTVRKDGIILYTYVFWNNWYTDPSVNWPDPSAVPRQHKVIVVVARFLDPDASVDDATARQLASVKLSAIAADIPELGQVK